VENGLGYTFLATRCW